ncbi:hypothetical protein EDC01DRAFT_631235 [Geopyxis carbonaria]|nr:hypothetical protein EDC01DRAFT_631235 [Geopyxis carbonaria]
MIGNMVQQQFLQTLSSMMNANEAPGTEYSNPYRYDMHCLYCGKGDHYIAACPAKRADEEKSMMTAGWRPHVPQGSTALAIMGSSSSEPHGQRVHYLPANTVPLPNASPYSDPNDTRDIDNASQLGSFVVDSGATDYIFNDALLFDKLECCDVVLNLGDGSWVVLDKCGYVLFDGFALFGLLAPGFKVNLVSIPYLDKRGWRTTFCGGNCVILDPDGVRRITAVLVDDLYIITPKCLPKVLYVEGEATTRSTDFRAPDSSFALATRRATRNMPGDVWFSPDPEAILRLARKTKRHDSRTAVREIQSSDLLTDMTSTVPWDYRLDLNSSSSEEDEIPATKHTLQESTMQSDHRERHPKGEYLSRRGIRDWLTPMLAPFNEF